MLFYYFSVLKLHVIYNDSKHFKSSYNKKKTLYLLRLSVFHMHIK